MQGLMTELNEKYGIAELQRQLDEWGGGTCPDQLWITCSEQSMIQSLEPILAAQPAFVLRSLGCDTRLFTSDDSRGMSAVDYAISELGVRKITIFGHSLCAGPYRWTPGSVPGAGVGYTSIVRRLRQREEWTVRLQQHLADQLAELSRHPSVARALSEDTLSLAAAFYLTESGVFMGVDAATRKFVPLHVA
jgi:carbonic anhydrase